MKKEDIGYRNTYKLINDLKNFMEYLPEETQNFFIKPIVNVLDKMNSLEKLVKNKRVALVGPSPHLVGSNLGDKIDSFDIVCRINESSICKKTKERLWVKN